MVNCFGDTGINALIALRTNAAGKTTISFSLCLLLSKTKTNFFKVRFSLVRVHQRIVNAFDFSDITGVGLIGQAFGPVMGAAFFNIFAFQIAVNRNSRFLTGIDGFDGCCGTGDYVAARENSGNVGGKSYGIGINIIPLINGNAGFFADKR